MRDLPPMFRFTIRDVLWLMVVVALGVAWWVERDRQAATSAAFADLKAENAYMRQFIESRYEYVRFDKWGWSYKEREQPSTDNDP